MITGHIAVVVIGDISRNVAEPVPVAGAGAISQGRSFDLVSRGRGSPDEIRWKCQSFVHIRLDTIFAGCRSMVAVQIPPIWR
jgi:hypothetical protein